MKFSSFWETVMSNVNPVSECNDQLMERWHGWMIQNFSWSHFDLGDCQQITFVRLNRFLSVDQTSKFIHTQFFNGLIVCWGEGAWASYQIFKKGGLAESQFLEEGSWKRGGDIILWKGSGRGGCSFYIRKN